MEWFDRQECLSYNCGPWVLERNANYAFRYSAFMSREQPAEVVALVRTFQLTRELPGLPMKPSLSK
jgi:hypothetical protein